MDILNHGAFGAALLVAYQRAADWRLHLERQPLRYHDCALLPHLAYSARRLSRFVSQNEKTLARLSLLPNVLSGMNSVLFGYARQFRSSHVILWDTAYGSVKQMANCYSKNVSQIPLLARLDQMVNIPWRIDRIFPFHT